MRGEPPANNLCLSSEIQGFSVVRDEAGSFLPASHVICMAPANLRAWADLHPRLLRPRFPSRERGDDTAR
jgi:hypothetical protein